MPEAALVQHVAVVRQRHGCSGDAALADQVGSVLLEPSFPASFSHEVLPCSSRVSAYSALTEYNVRPRLWERRRPHPRPLSARRGELIQASPLSVSEGVGGEVLSTGP